MAQVILVVVLAVVGSYSCVDVMAVKIERLRHTIRSVNCQDGQPVRVLIDPHCPDTICGVTCAPDRWLVR